MYFLKSVFFVFLRKVTFKKGNNLKKKSIFRSTFLASNFFFYFDKKHVFFSIFLWGRMLEKISGGNKIKEGEMGDGRTRGGTWITRLLPLESTRFRT